MIDIIIPVYNSHKTIVETLSSVAIQKLKDKVKVYIIDDCSEKDYEKELMPFKDILDIKYTKLNKNMGPGYARQYGIEISDSEYIIFLDSDDQLYNYYSLDLLYNYINENELDVVMGYYYIEENNNRFLSTESHIYGCLHGKVYRRKYLVDNNIKFNNSRYSEDNSFNSTAVLTTNKTMIIDNIVYVYRNNKDSLTKSNNLVKIHCSYLHNMLWLINNLEKRKVEKEIIITVLVNSYAYIYKEVKANNKIRFNKLYIYCSKFEEKFKEYEKDITEDFIFECLDYQLNCGNLMRKTIIKDFNKFRKKFKKNQVII